MESGRVVLDARILRGAPGGVATYVAALVRHLPAIAPHVAFVFLRHPDAQAPLSRASNVVEWLCPGDPNHPVSYLRMGAWLKRRLGPRDIYHMPCRMLPRGAPENSVLTMHDAMQVLCPELVFPNPLVRTLVKPYWSAAVRSSLRRARRILAVSRHTADDTLRLDPSVHDRLRVTHLGVDPVFAPMPQELALRRTADIVPGGMRFFLVLGGGFPNKNHVGAIRAFARAFTSADGVHLVIIQRDRSHPPEVARALRDAGLLDRVHVRSKVSLDVLLGLYARAEALVFPSLYEGFGLPVLEAMASGCPVVCSNLTSIPEVVGDAALMRDPRDVDAFADALREVVRDPSLRRDLVARGLARASSFRWEDTARRTWDAYCEIGHDRG